MHAINIKGVGEDGLLYWYSDIIKRLVVLAAPLSLVLDDKIKNFYTGLYSDKKKFLWFSTNLTISQYFLNQEDISK